MTYKQIEASREARLWIGQVIVPAAVGVAMVLSKPEARDFVKEKYNSLKEKISTKFHKN